MLEVIHALAAAYDAYNATYTAQTQYVRDLATAVMPFTEVTGAFLAAIQRQQGMNSSSANERYVPSLLVRLSAAPFISQDHLQPIRTPPSPPLHLPLT